ncbi:hypothetical protein [uncultured Pelagimonas sp.]|uniref:hypothetical protein n=1 Tax=uncultured Pelagimonas sp. TaxID=1618102 RepID=UPI00260700FD|nr:hypothetical protein [uncultured Pelagimonas sp.]
MRLPIWALPALLCACGHVDQTKVAPGEFEGQAVVVWVGSGANSGYGDGSFIYVPIPGAELSFVRNPKANPSPGTEVITPEAFYTDGGSVPRGAQNLPGFNAWAYGPAYVIHDWAFVARKCLNDEGSVPDDLITEEMRNIRNMTFVESAYLMAETIETLALEHGSDDVSKRVVPSFTAGAVTHALWQKKGVCEDQHLSPEHREIVDQIQAERSTIAPEALVLAPRGRALPTVAPSVAAPLPYTVISVIAPGG